MSAIVHGGVQFLAACACMPEYRARLKPHRIWLGCSGVLSVPNCDKYNNSRLQLRAGLVLGNFENRNKYRNWRFHSDLSVVSRNAGQFWHDLSGKVLQKNCMVSWGFVGVYLIQLCLSCILNVYFFTYNSDKAFPYVNFVSLVICMSVQVMRMMTSERWKVNH